MTPTKQVRTLCERLKIIEEYEKNPKEKRTIVAKRLGLAASTLNSIIAKKDVIRAQIAKIGIDSKRRKSSKNSTYSELESILYTWYTQAKATNMPINGILIREQGLRIANQMGNYHFSASNGWITRFKERHGIVYRKQPPAGTPVEMTADMWRATLPQLIEGYEPRNIFHAVEFGLFYNYLPDVAQTLTGETCQYGEAAEDRISVLLCANSDGSEKLQPIVIGSKADPSCVNDATSLPVEYHANAKSWMTNYLFTTFLMTLNASMDVQGRKILLLLDKCAAHPQDTPYLRNITVKFFPANSRSELQPLHMGVVQRFKRYYRQSLVHKTINILEENIIIDVKSVKIDLSQAIDSVAGAWSKIMPATVSNCFRKCGVKSAPESSFYVVMVKEELEEEDFTEEWWHFYPEQTIPFESYVEFDDALATCGVESIEDLCASVAKPKRVRGPAVQSDVKDQRLISRANDSEILSNDVDTEIECEVKDPELTTRMNDSETGINDDDTEMVADVKDPGLISRVNDSEMVCEVDDSEMAAKDKDPGGVRKVIDSDMSLVNDSDTVSKINDLDMVSTVNDSDTVSKVNEPDMVCKDEDSRVGGEVEPNALPTFANVLAALEQVKTFLYAHPIEQNEREALSLIERSLFAANHHELTRDTLNSP